MKIKSEEIRKNNINNIKNEINNSNKYTYIKPKSKILKSRKSKTPLENNLFQKAIKKVNFINDIQKSNSTDKINFKKNEIINKKVKENHERIEKEDNSFISQKYPYMKKKALKENISPSTSFQENNNKNKNKNITSNNQINNNINSQKNNLILLSNIITSSQKKEKVKENNNILNTSTKKIEEIFLEPKKYEEYITNSGNKIIQETFCEAFFIASFPKINGQVIEKSQSFPALCGHKECSNLPSMKSEIIYRYPLKDTKNLELNNFFKKG